jgi:hypothetical protein
MAACVVVVSVVVETVVEGAVGAMVVGVAAPAQ